ncbi:SIMPL domain-containing protein [Candidatus Curtissbacteria bacterium]|nr:SIMPL domain-containing protein [Candidatus Curtissbacteria bacterium]
MAKPTPNYLLKTLIWPVVVLVIAAAVLYLKPWQQKPIETVSVAAAGVAKATPNIAKITATIDSKNPNIDQARKETQAKAGIIVDKLKVIGVDEKDIKTNNVSAGGSYEVMIYSPVQNTNQFTESFEITLHDFNKADQVLQTLTQNGATNLYGPNLTIDESNLESAKSQARQNAVENAKKKAQELAGATGRKIGKVVKIAEQGDYAYPRPLMAVGGTDLKEKAATIQPGQNEVTITLQVDFSLN